MRELPNAAIATEKLLTDQLRLLGPDHTDTLATRGRLANWRGKAGDPVGAVGFVGEFKRQVSVTSSAAIVRPGLVSASFGATWLDGLLGASSVVVGGCEVKAQL